MPFLQAHPGAAATSIPPLPSLHTLPLAEGDAATSTTLCYIRKLVDEAVKDPLVNRTAIAILRQARVRAFDFAGEIRALYEWTRKNIRFTRDITGKETLRSAREILTVRAGDCDDINAILLPAFLATVGHRVRLITISSHPQAPDLFTHIYAEVFSNGQWVPVDAARRHPRLGRAPETYFRKRIWSLTDSDYEDVAGLGYYTPHGAAMRRRGGMGQDDGGVLDEGATGINWSWTAPTDIYTPLSTTIAPSATDIATGGFNWNSFFTNLFGMGAKITPGIVSALNQPGIRPLYGTAYPYGTYPAASSSLGISSGTLLLIGAGILVIAMVGKGRG